MLILECVQDTKYLDILNASRIIILDSAQNPYDFDMLKTSRIVIIDSAQELTFLTCNHFDILSMLEKRNFSDN